MPGLHSFESAFARELQLRIDRVIQERALTMAQGGHVVEDNPMATASQYVSGVGYIKALQHVLEWCRDVEDDLTGRSAAQKKGANS